MTAPPPGAPHGAAPGAAPPTAPGAVPGAVPRVREAGPPDAGRFGPRRTAGVLRPRSVAEVVDLVRAAAGSRTPLHPVSTGRNWGLGSGLPVEDGAAVLDLSGLDAVRETDIRRGWAVVEPGVTQGRLTERLAGTERMLNLTGASRHTSVIGNILERGVGLHRPRAEDLAGLELVLADGARVRTGWWPAPDGPAVVQPHGRGPSLNHLFTQASWAVVTAAVVRLLPRPRAVRVLPVVFPPDALAEAVDTLRAWTAGGSIPATTKIYDPVAARTYGIGGPSGPTGSAGAHLAHIALTGDADTVAARTGVLAARLREASCPLREGPSRAADAEVHAAYAGVHDPHDSLFRRKTAGTCARCLDRVGGLLMFLPVVPFEGAAVAEAAALVGAALADGAARPGITMNVLDADTVDHVVTLRFDPADPVSTAAAHRTLDRLHTTFGARGWPAYRPDVDHPLTGAADPVLHGRLAGALDPHGVFARGRFGPSRSDGGVPYCT
ncbi:FAD-binding oxidoreductase [Streptomyces sp. NPDC004111]|uniref:FAD-binding oxidoreductase n=1 Tax=Streptomyces sp. NPDC004111 TaxID=3364690 RepID=UPI0036B61619